MFVINWMRNKKITINFFYHTFKCNRILIVIVYIVTTTKFFSIRYIDIDKALIIFINCLLFDWYIIRSTIRKIIFKNDITIFEKILFFFYCLNRFEYKQIIFSIYFWWIVIVWLWIVFRKFCCLTSWIIEIFYHRSS